MKHLDAQQSSRPMYSMLSSEDEAIDISKVVGVLWRGKLLLLVAITFCGAIGFYHAFFVAVPKYRATASLVLNTQGEQVVDIESVVSGVSKDTTSINTQLEVIRSRSLIGKLVNELDLMNDPEFNSALRPPPKFSLRRTILKFRDLLATVIPRHEAPEAPATPGAVSAQSASSRFDSVVSSVRSVINPNSLRYTYVMNISVTTTDRRKSQQMANTLAELYIRDQIEVKYQATENATTWLSQRLVELEQELDAKESELKALRSVSTVSSPEGLFALNVQVQDLRSKLITARNRSQETEALISDIARIRLLPEMEQAREWLSSDDPVIQRLARQVVNGDNGAQGLLEERVAERLSDARQQLLRLETQEQTLQNGITNLEETLDTQTVSLQEVQQAERDIQASRTLYETFLTRLKETSVQRGMQQADSRILSAATPGVYTEPLKGRIVLLGCLIGFCLGAAFLFVRQFTTRHVRSSSELEEVTNLPVLGQIPVMPKSQRNSLIPYLYENPASMTAEAVRNLRTSLLMSDLDRQPQIIMITSSIPGEGKTTNSISLAQNLVGLGKRVLLMECDIRRQTLSQYFDVSRSTAGLLTALSGSKPLNEVIFHDSRLGADVLLGERSKVNAADTFSSEAFSSFLQELRKHYDFVILDTPPVLVAPDARIVGQQADATLYAVAWDSTSRKQVREGLQMLDTVNVSVTGLILTKIDPKGMKRYGYGDSYGSYAYRNSSYYGT